MELPVASQFTNNHYSVLTNTIPNHPLLTDLEQKNDLFDKAASKYAAKIAA